MSSVRIRIIEKNWLDILSVAKLRETHDCNSGLSKQVAWTKHIIVLCYQYIHTEYIAYHYNNNSYHILKNNYVRLTKKYIIKVIGVAELLYESVFQSIIWYLIVDIIYPRMDRAYIRSSAIAILRACVD